MPRPHREDWRRSALQFRLLAGRQEHRWEWPRKPRATSFASCLGGGTGRVLEAAAGGLPCYGFGERAARSGRAAFLGDFVYRELIVTSLPGETRMALLEDGAVVELGVEHRSEQSVLHGIYRGRVQRIVPSTQAAFLDIGLHRNAFLQVDQIPGGALAAWRDEGRMPEGARKADGGGADAGPSRGRDGISGSNGAASGFRLEDVLRSGQPVLVQVVREPLGPKGYKVSCDLNLQGRFFDFRPLAATGIITSRATAGPREQVRIAALAERRTTLKGEWVARSTAEQRDEENLAADIARLEADWVQIRKESLSGPAACLRAEVPMVFRYIRDVLSSGFSVIRVDSETLYGRMVNFIRQFLPGMEHKVRLYSRNYPIFEEYGVETALSRPPGAASGCHRGARSLSIRRKRSWRWM